MTIADQAAKYRASPKLIRKMIERGDSPNPIKGNLASIIRERLSVGEQLSVEHLLALGSGLIDHNQKMTVAAMQMADMKVCAQRS